MSIWKRVNNLARGKLKVLRTGGSASITDDERDELEKELAELEREAAGLAGREPPAESDKLRREIDKLRAEADELQREVRGGTPPRQVSDAGRDLWPADDGDAPDDDGDEPKPKRSKKRSL